MQRVEGDHAQHAVPAERVGDGGAEPGAGRLDEAVDVGGGPGPQAQRLEDPDQVADRDALVEQAAQHALDLAERQLRRDELLDDDGVHPAHGLHQRLDVLAGQQPGGVGADDLAEVGDEHRAAVDDGRAGHLGLVAHLDRQPLAVQAEDGLDRRRAGQGLQVVAEGEDLAGGGLAAADLHAGHEHLVLPGGQVEGVAGAHGRQDEADLEGDLAAQRADPVEQVAAGAGVDEVDEVGGEDDLERVDGHLLRRASRSGRPRAGRAGRRRRGPAASARRARWAATSMTTADDEERRLGQARARGR